MKLTYNQLLIARPAINDLLSLSPPPTARLSVQITRNVRKISEALGDFDKAHKLLQEHYTADGVPFDYEKLDDVKRAALDAEFDELKDTEIKVDLHPIKISEIAAVEDSRPGFAIPVAAFYVADFLFEDNAE